MKHCGKYRVSLKFPNAKPPRLTEVLGDDLTQEQADELFHQYVKHNTTTQHVEVCYSTPRACIEWRELQRLKQLEN